MMPIFSQLRQMMVSTFSVEVQRKKNKDPTKLPMYMQENRQLCKHIRKKRIKVERKKKGQVGRKCMQKIKCPKYKET